MNLELNKTLVDWAQVLGAAFSLLALMLALFAIQKGRRDLANERRCAHELQILRDIGEQFGSFLRDRWRLTVDARGITVDPGEEGATPLGDYMLILRSRLLMLPVNDFPMTRAALGMPVADEVRVVFDRHLHHFLADAAKKPDVAADDEGRAAWIERNLPTIEARWLFLAATRENPQRYGLLRSSLARSELDAAINSRTSI